jgi:hypothetical protein
MVAEKRTNMQEEAEKLEPKDLWQERKTGSLFPLYTTHH